MPLPRMTTRRRMIAIAVFALLITGVVALEVMKKRRNEYQVEAGMHRSMEQIYRRFSAIASNRAKSEEIAASLQGAIEAQEYAKSERAKAELCSKWAEYCAFMGKKYEYAASHPWLPVEPDPSRPE